MKLETLIFSSHSMWGRSRLSLEGISDQRKKKKKKVLQDFEYFVHLAIMGCTVEKSDPVFDPHFFIPGEI